MSKAYFQIPYSPITSYFFHPCGCPTSPEETFCCDETCRIVAPDSNGVAENVGLHDQVRQSLLDDIVVWHNDTSEGNLIESTIHEAE